ncbi:lipopolysaccharide biosynthesis protein [Georgenia yuyongxinii]|uniref:Lipopolysaccharide biosynthesis protein n=2 Tax=Georgenia yuyongxinii TaxID=2589797 RepID=A0A5B8C5L3_9MICO|nr:lipopolysaccharide biosynthesis protein [Georgenia yuyongxinii]
MPGSSTMNRIRRYVGEHEFARHFLTLFSGSAIAQAIPIAASVVLTRLYEPADYGVLALYTSIVSAIATMAAWRYDVAIVLPRSDAEGRGLVRLSSRLVTVTAVVLTLVMLPLAGPIAQWLDAPALQPWLYLAGLNILVLGHIQIYISWLNRRKSYATMSGNRMLQAVGTTGTQLAAGFAGAGAPGLIGGTFVGPALGLALLARRARPEPGAAPAETAGLLRRYWRMPVLNGPTALIDAFRLNGINVLIGRIFGNALLGQFSLAWRTVQAPLTLVNGALSQIYYQRFATTERGGMRALAWWCVSRSTLLGVVPFAALFFLAEPAFAFVFGEQWRLAGRLAELLVPWLYLNFITSPLSTVFLVVERQGVSLAFSVIYMAVPLLTLLLAEGGIEAVVTLIAIEMAGLLVVFIGLALWVAGEWDKRAQRTAAAH